jgi:hypothetical protein
MKTIVWRRTKILHFNNIGPRAFDHKKWGIIIRNIREWRQYSGEGENRGIFIISVPGRSTTKNRELL